MIEEKCFIVKEENPIYNKYFDWWNNQENLHKKWEQFKNLVGLEADKFVPRRQLYIIPTENDKIKFGKMFCKEDFGQGLKKLKANSILQKDWEKFIDNNKVLVSKPDFMFDFIGKCISGRMQSRLFHYKDIVYASLNGEFYPNSPIPEGYEEIKKSEFYKIIETIEKEKYGG